MKKVLDKDLEMLLDKMSASETVATLKELQDASGLKICQNVTPSDPAYREIKSKITEV